MGCCRGWHLNRSIRFEIPATYDRVRDRIGEERPYPRGRIRHDEGHRLICVGGRTAFGLGHTTTRNPHTIHEEGQAAAQVPECPRRFRRLRGPYPQPQAPAAACDPPSRTPPKIHRRPQSTSRLILASTQSPSSGPPFNQIQIRISHSPAIMTDAADEPQAHQAAPSEPQLRFGLQFQVGAIALLEALCLLFSISTITSTCKGCMCVLAWLLLARSFNLGGGGS